MAEVFIDRDTIHVVLGSIERIGALHGDLAFPISCVRGASVSQDPFAPLRGIRSPGTGCPGLIALGTWRSKRHGRTFAAAYRGRPALVLDLYGDPFWSRVVVSTDDAPRLASVLTAPAGWSPDRR